MGLFEWWSEQNTWVKYGVALLLLAISTVLFFLGRIWPWGWVSGVVLLMISGKSDSDENGFKF